jgi:hypothetical protein
MYAVCFPPTQSVCRAPNSAGFQNIVTIALRSRSSKLLKSISCSGLGLGGYQVSPGGLCYRGQTLGLRSVLPSLPLVSYQRAQARSSI